MTATSTHETLALAASAAVVAASTEEMKKIGERVDKLTNLTRESAAQTPEADFERGEEDPSTRFASSLEGAVETVTELFQRQDDALRTFNIVLCGRTIAVNGIAVSAKHINTSTVQ